MNKEDLLIEYIIKDLVDYLIEDEGMDMQTALSFVYNSTTYTKVADKETGLYHKSSDYVYEMLKSEYRLGGVVPPSQTHN